MGGEGVAIWGDLGHFQPSALNDYENINGPMHPHRLESIKSNGHIKPQIDTLF
jgi:hypothetical protein